MGDWVLADEESIGSSSAESKPSSNWVLVKDEPAASAPTSEPAKLNFPEKIADFVTGGMISEGKQIQNDASAGLLGDKAQVFSQASQSLQNNMKLAGQIGQSIILGKQAGILVDGKVPTITKRILEGMAGAQSFDYKNVKDRVKSTVIAGGISAAAGAVGDKILRKFFTHTAKLPSSLEAEDAIAKINQSTDDIIEKSKDYLNTTKQRASTDASFKAIEDKVKINNLEIQKTKIADQQSRLIQEELAPQASKNLNQAFAEKYLAKAKGKTVSIDDVSEGLKDVLQDHKIIDDQGALLLQEKDLSKPERLAYGLYKDYASKIGNTESIPLVEFDSDLKANLMRGKQYGSEERILTDVRRAMADKVAELREVGRDFADDFQYRNAAFDKFKPYQTRAGYRRGDADVSTGMNLLKNLAHEDSSQALPQNQRIMDFVKKYTGVDPSEPVKHIGGQIKGMMAAAQEEAFKMQYSLAEVEARVQKSVFDTEAMRQRSIRGLSGLRAIALKKEAKDALIKKIALIGGTSALAGAIGSKGANMVSKFIPK